MSLSARIITALIVGAIAGFLAQAVPVGIAVFAVSLVIILLPIYVRYAKDNPNRYWFKRKMFGWGWTPVTWQGWFVMILYIALLVLIFQYISNYVIPFIVLTLLFVWVVYKHGEKPKWQWGKDLGKYR